ncbi:MAG: elongation factor P hydroxylase [Halioglobus sp.]
MDTAVASQSASARFWRAATLEDVFNRSFEQAFNTRLVGGHDEPLYLPPGEGGNCSQVQYRLDYFASALHEVAHWCLAGKARCQLVDYGYWYAPDGRDVHQQKAFEAVEYKPQALEWVFSRACGYPFEVSLDNLDVRSGEIPDTSVFKKRVHQQVLDWQNSGLSTRAAMFFYALCREFGQDSSFARLEFELTELS